MALLIICNDRDLTPWIDALKVVDFEIDIRVYPEEGNTADIEFVLCWKHPKGILNRYKNLKAISSLGAGVDHLFNDPNLPPGVPIVRIVDPELAQAMSEFVIGLIFNHIRSLTAYSDLQKQNIWESKPFKISQNVNVGIMGLGVLGQDLALKLKQIGFKVSGWSLSEKSLESIKTYQGDSELESFLSEAQILICLLPLTKETENILNKDHFQKLPDHSFIINVARGEHLVEEDLIEMINKKKIAGACLDVFRQEPLPADHPFWKHPKIKITPHIASLTNPVSVAPQIVENYHRAKSGKELLNQVSTELGY